MTTKISISVDDRTYNRILNKKNGLTVSEYIQEQLLNMWELQDRKLIKREVQQNED
jgi:hypothetical protein